MTSLTSIPLGSRTMFGLRAGLSDFAPSLPFSLLINPGIGMDGNGMPSKYFVRLARGSVTDE